MAAHLASRHVGQYYSWMILPGVNIILIFVDTLCPAVRPTPSPQPLPTL